MYFFSEGTVCVSCLVIEKHSLKLGGVVTLSCEDLLLGYMLPMDRTRPTDITELGVPQGDATGGAGDRVTRRTVKTS